MDFDTINIIGVYEREREIEKLIDNFVSIDSQKIRAIYEEVSARYMSCAIKTFLPMIIKRDVEKILIELSTTAP